MLCGFHTFSLDSKGLPAEVVVGASAGRRNRKAAPSKTHQKMRAEAYSEDLNECTGLKTVQLLGTITVFPT